MEATKSMGKTKKVQVFNALNLHKIHKRNVETNSAHINTSFYSDLNNNETLGEEFIQINDSIPNVENIDPLKRRGKEGVIYIHGLFEMSNGDCRAYPETGQLEFKAAQLAIKHVNEKQIIDGYQLEMYYNDTKCDSGVAVDAFFHSLYRQPTMSVILGPGSSEVTERLARVVSRWNVMQMSYGATSPVLSDRENFPLFFRTIAPISSHNAALLAFILHHKWLTVAALHEQGDKHALPMTKLITDLEQVNITVKVAKGISERDFQDHLQELKVYHLGMYGAEYAWIILRDTADSWWKDVSKSECSYQQMMSAIEGMISIGSLYQAMGNVTAVSEGTITEILNAVGFKEDPHSAGYISQTYDAVWAIALAFRNVERIWRTANSSYTLGDFTYDNYFMAQNFSAMMRSLRFNGVSGPVSFYNSDRVGITAFHQKQGKNMKLTAIYNPDDSQLDFYCTGCKRFIWQGGSPPISRRIIVLRIAILDRRVFICVTALATVGVMLALVFLSFNLYYRKLKFIKLSSPNLNNFVVVGCVLVYIAVILLGVDHGTLISDDHFPVVCSARAFLLSGGFSLAFGCMFIKTYRVYHIFIRANTGIVKSKLLHDKQLLGMVSVLLLVDCVLVTLWVTVDPMERQLTHLSLQVNKEERNVGYLYLREHCSSAHMAKWLGSLYIYKGLLLIVGCYMAWETRHVKVPALNDSQYIGMSVYNVVITSIIVVALANIIPADRYTLTFVLVSTLIFVSTTTTLCILFVPKIHTILINPEDAAVVATPGVKVECKTRRFAIDEPRESLYRAEILNRALKRELLELEEEYNKIAKKVGFTPCGVRKQSLSSGDQDDDSDDGLPPWLEEYKDYSNSNHENVWYTDRPTIASAFMTLHGVALQLPSTSSRFREQPSVKSKPDSYTNTTNYSSYRASIISTSDEEIFPQTCAKHPSDRVLNKIKIPLTLQETDIDDADGSLNTTRNFLPSFSGKRLRSEPKLYSDIHDQISLQFSSCPSKSLNHISLLQNSLSDFSKSTSAVSTFTTAPFYDSTSFSTPSEDFLSSPNNENDSNKSHLRSTDNNTTSNYMTCDEGIVQEINETLYIQRDAKQNICSNTPLNVSENTTFCDFSTNKSHTNALSGSSSSLSGATLSDLSTDTNEEIKHEIIGAVKIGSDSNTKITSNLFNLESLTLKQDQSISRSKINEINTSTVENKTSIDNAQSSKPMHINSINKIADKPENEIIDKYRSLLNVDINDPTQSSDRVNDNEIMTSDFVQAHKTSPQPVNTVQIDNLRNQIFRLERELILLQFDQSDSVDL